MGRPEGVRGEAKWLSSREHAMAEGSSYFSSQWDLTVCPDEFLNISLMLTQKPLSYWPLSLSSSSVGGKMGEEIRN